MPSPIRGSWMRRTKQLAASVVFAEPPHGPYDYSRAARRWRRSSRPGQRVQVPLGKRQPADRRLLHGVRPQAGRPAAAQAARPRGRRRSRCSRRRCCGWREWMSDYYLCPLGQVLQAIVPAGVRGKAGTREMTFLSVPTQSASSSQPARSKLGEKQLDALRILAASPRPLTPPELAQAAKCTLGPIGELRKKKLVDGRGPPHPADGGRGDGRRRAKSTCSSTPISRWRSTASWPRSATAGTRRS